MSARSAVPLVVPTAAPTQPLCAGRVVIDGQDFGYVHVADALAGELASDEAAMAASVSLESPLKSRGSSLGERDLAIFLLFFDLTFSPRRQPTRT